MKLSHMGDGNMKFIISICVVTLCILIFASLIWSAVPAQATNCSITLSPASGNAGDNITITGIAFTPNSVLEFRFDTTTIMPVAGQDSSLITGAFASVISIPYTTAGAHIITVTAGTTTASATFTVTPTVSALLWNTFLGGGSDDNGQGIVVDRSGNVYVTGTSSATWGSPVRVYNGSSDAYVAKLNNGGTLLWNTFLGSGGHDFSYGITVDDSGNVYVTGTSKVTWGNPVREFSGGLSGDTFAAKLDSSGNLIWNTFLGESGYYAPNTGIAVDGNGNVYVTGSSAATWGNPVRAYTNYNAFVAKLNSSGTILWNTFLGATGDNGLGITVDGSGNVYITGSSDATWGSPVRAFTPSENDDADAFVAQLNSSGTLLWNTFLGGAGEDCSYGIAVDVSGNIYTIGYSGFSDTGWGSPVQPYNTSTFNAFAAKINKRGVLQWNTFFGALEAPQWNIFEGAGIIVDGDGNVYATGRSDATWGFPERAYNNSSDAFVVKLDSSGALQRSTFLGGSGWDIGQGIAMDATGNVYVTGSTEATWDSPVRAYTYNDAFVAKLNYNTLPTPASNASLVMAPVSGPAGSDVTISGSDFPANSALVLKIDSTAITPRSGDTATRASGIFTTVITVPTSAAAGVHYITVMVGTTTISTLFTVISLTYTSPTPTLTPNLTPALTPVPTTTLSWSEEIEKAIEKAQQAISAEKSKGFDMSQAEALLVQAQLTYPESNLMTNKAITTAEKAERLAIDIDSDGVLNELDFAPTINNYYIYAGVCGLILVSASLVTVYFVRRRRLARVEIEKQKTEIIDMIDKAIK